MTDRAALDAIQETIRNRADANETAGRPRDENLGGLIWVAGDIASQLEEVQNDFALILEQVTTGQISVEDAARRAHLLEAEPQQYHCGTCRFYRDDMCQSPNHPPRPEHPLSARCGRYEQRPDRRDLTMPEQQSRRDMMFK